MICGGCNSPMVAYGSQGQIAGAQQILLSSTVPSHCEVCVRLAAMVMDSGSVLRETLPEPGTLAWQRCRSLGPGVVPLTKIRRTINDYTTKLSTTGWYNNIKLQTIHSLSAPLQMASRRVRRAGERRQGDCVPTTLRLCLSSRTNHATRRQVERGAR